MSKHYVIFIPGLGDDTGKMILGTKHWKKYGLEPLVHSVGWRDLSSDFQIKLNKLLEIIDNLIVQGNEVSLIGTSAGGSMALNAFYERKDKINKVINVCGRLKTGSACGFRSFKSKTATSSAFAQSIKLCESRESLWSDPDRQRIMTVKPLFGDELVPPDTTIVKGAYNIFIPTGEHVLSNCSGVDFIF